MEKSITIGILAPRGKMGKSIINTTMYYQDITGINIYGKLCNIAELNNSSNNITEFDNLDSIFKYSDIIIDFELDTHVKEICFSACPLLLVGGETRTLERGSKIGFHRSSWKSDSMKSFYEDKETREIYGWKNEFDFSSWVYDDSQEEIYSQFKYYLERGVSPSFVIETMKARSEDGWYPRRKDLLEANVITK